MHPETLWSLARERQASYLADASRTRLNRPRIRLAESRRKRGDRK